MVNEAFTILKKEKRGKNGGNGRREGEGQSIFSVRKISPVQIHTLLLFSAVNVLTPKRSPDLAAPSNVSNPHVMMYVYRYRKTTEHCAQPESISVYLRPIIVNTPYQGSLKAPCPCPP